MCRPGPVFDGDDHHVVGVHCDEDDLHQDDGEDDDDDDDGDYDNDDDDDDCKERQIRNADVALQSLTLVFITMILQ